MKYRRVRGTEDIFGTESEKWQQIDNIFKHICGLYGYSQIQTPVIEHSELFRRSIGEATDIVEKEIFQFQDRSGRDLSLRPEATASIIRAYLENSLYQSPGVVKLYYSGAMFRAERPQKGRKREFHQFGVEAIGSYGPELDCETIMLANRLLRSIGIEGSIIELNTLGCRKDKKKIAGYLKDIIGKNIPDLCPKCSDRFERNILRVLDCKNQACRDVLGNLNVDIKKAVCPDCINHFQELKRCLDGMGFQYRENNFLVRGLDYYSRTVFEVIHTGLGAQNAVGAGGRYDNLVEDMGGRPEGAVGFAFGLERLSFIAANLPSCSRMLDVFIVLQDYKLVGEALKEADFLRAENISVDIDFQGRSVKSQMRLANDRRARFVLIIGQEEAQKGVCSLKDMSTGEQKSLTRKDVFKTIKGGVNC
ncbi:MAG: histidine--tRNA ligase [Candidatus Omnitrophica bacterium]|nr:histidine--tRNA ligase [Candidatus Omnitrophota bacterium]